MGTRRGIRFSAQDGIVILIAAVVTSVLWKTVPMFAPALPIVLGHFFLFCNVFLVPRRLELIWAGFFLVNCAFWMVEGKGRIQLVGRAGQPVAGDDGICCMDGCAARLPRRNVEKNGVTRGQYSGVDSSENRECGD